MNSHVSRFTVLACLLTSAVTCQAGKLVVILHRGGTVWQVQDAEKVTINTKNKIRQGSAGKLQVSNETYKQMAPLVIGAAALRVHRDGYLAVWSGSSWSPVAPDGISLKTPATMASLWISAAVQIQIDAKGKPVEYKSADVFAIVPGSSAADAAVDFLANEANFTGIGEKDPADAFNERMSLLVGIAGLARHRALCRNRAGLEICRGFGSGLSDRRRSEEIAGCSARKESFPRPAHGNSESAQLRGPMGRLYQQVRRFRTIR
jgi:hypothetical protein